MPPQDPPGFAAQAARVRRAAGLRIALRNREAGQAREAFTSRPGPRVGGGREAPVDAAPGFGDRRLDRLAAAQRQDRLIKEGRTAPVAELATPEARSRGLDLPVARGDLSQVGDPFQAQLSPEDVEIAEFQRRGRVKGLGGGRGIATIPGAVAGGLSRGLDVATTILADRIDKIPSLPDQLQVPDNPVSRFIDQHVESTRRRRFALQTLRDQEHEQRPGTLSRGVGRSALDLLLGKGGIDERLFDLTSDFTEIGTEFAVARRLLPRVFGQIPQAAEAGAARRIATKALGEAAQFGAFEAGLSALEGNELPEIIDRTTGGAIAGGVIGTVTGSIGAAMRAVGARTAAQDAARRRVLRLLNQQEAEVRAEQERFVQLNLPPARAGTPSGDVVSRGIFGDAPDVVLPPSQRGFAPGGLSPEAETAARRAFRGDAGRVVSVGPRGPGVLVQPKQLLPGQQRTPPGAIPAQPAGTQRQIGPGARPAGPIPQVPVERRIGPPTGEPPMGVDVREEAFRERERLHLEAAERADFEDRLSREPPQLPPGSGRDATGRLIPSAPVGSVVSPVEVAAQEARIRAGLQAKIAPGPPALPPGRPGTRPGAFAPPAPAGGVVSEAEAEIIRGATRVAEQALERQRAVALASQRTTIEAKKQARARGEKPGTPLVSKPAAQGELSNLQPAPGTPKRGPQPRPKETASPKGRGPDALPEPAGQPPTRRDRVPPGMKSSPVLRIRKQKSRNLPVEKNTEEELVYRIVLQEMRIIREGPKADVRSIVRQKDDLSLPFTGTVLNFPFLNVKMAEKQIRKFQAELNRRNIPKHEIDQFQVEAEAKAIKEEGLTPIDQELFRIRQISDPNMAQGKTAGLEEFADQEFLQRVRRPTTTVAEQNAAQDARDLVEGELGPVLEENLRPEDIAQQVEVSPGVFFTNPFLDPKVVGDALGGQTAGAVTGGVSGARLGVEVAESENQSKLAGGLIGGATGAVAGFMAGRLVSRLNARGRVQERGGLQTTVNQVPRGRRPSRPAGDPLVPFGVPGRVPAYLQRLRELQAIEQARIKSGATNPRGVPPKGTPAHPGQGPDGPVDFKTDPATGKRIPDERTAGAVLKKAFYDEAGTVPFSKDPLELQFDLQSLPAHSQRIQNKLQIGGGGGRGIPSVLDLYTRLVRKVGEVESISKALGGKRDLSDPGIAVELASGSARRAEAAFEYGPTRLDAHGNWKPTGTPGLKEILAPLRGKINDLRRYLVAMRTIEVNRSEFAPGGAGKARNINTGISVDDAMLEVQGATEDIVLAQKQIVQYLRDVLQYYADATGMAPAMRNRLFSLGNDYIPLIRVFEGKDPLGQGVGRVGAAPNVLKRLVGSERDIVDPIESIIDYTKRVIRSADINRIAKGFVDLAETNPELATGVIAKIERPARGATQVSRAAVRLQEAANRRGSPMTDQEAQILAESLGADQLTIADGIVRVWNKGKLETYRVNEALARGIKGLQPQDMDPFFLLFGAPARLARAGITLNPGFQAWNIFRDTFDAAIQSEYGFVLGVDSFRGFLQSARATWFGSASEAYKEFAQAGGGFASARGHGRRTTQAILRRVMPKVETRSGRTIDILTLPIRQPASFLKEFAAPFEEAARVGEFMKARSRSASMVEAVLASKKVTVDFNQMGSMMQGMSYMTMFLNAGVQSLDTAIRAGIRPVTKGIAAGAERGLGAGLGVSAKEAASVYGNALIGITLPSVYFWHASLDDQEIQDLRKTKAGLIFWFVRTPSGRIWRLPKPFLWGQIFGTGAEAVLDKLFLDDEDAMRRWRTGIMEQAAINMVPNAIAIPIEQWANKDLTFGSPIVPPELEKVEPEFQLRDRTTRFSAKLGQMFNWSPARIDALVRDVGGTLSVEMLRAADFALDRMGGDETITKPASFESDIPFFGRFVQRSPSLSAKPVLDFWENAREMETVTETLDLLDKQNNAQRLATYLNENSEEVLLAAIYEGARKEITDIRNTIEEVRLMPNAIFQPGDDVAQIKRDITNTLLKAYIEKTREANAAAEVLRRPPTPGGQ